MANFQIGFAEMEIGSIILSDNKLSNFIPPRLFHSLSLSVLSLSRKNFSGQLPENIGDATEIMILMLAGNNLSGPIPVSISKIYRLLLLGLSQNRFSGNTFPVFSPLLAFIDFSANEFSGVIPETFSEETRILSLGNNKFSGPLPRNRTRLSKLQHLDLHDNKITGEVPTFLSEIPTLQVLNLRNNSLKDMGNLLGMIETPVTYSSISDMFTFSIEFKDLLVNWKKSIQGLSSRSLEIYSLLDLSRNQLLGEIPASLGTIPQTLTKLQELTTLDVSNNELIGKIPVGGQMDTMNDPNYYANNSGLCGMQIQVQCPEKPPSEEPQEDESEEESWFSWEGAAIGFPLGLFLSKAIICLTGYLVPAKQPNHLSFRRRRRV
ncbi:hypothetical protein Vadar_021112 [Vaccinium darrowii]|uniref:Uncharacterized protein n=1 Tax=Vaccinium darrowii TaxID=229202 RepID=A0ACB7XBW0_9ERIC|nr:hypothetical protein Vadar_021112 [Vaccinium darrowii]